MSTRVFFYVRKNASFSLVNLVSLNSEKLSRSREMSSRSLSISKRKLNINNSCLPALRNKSYPMKIPFTNDVCTACNCFSLFTSSFCLKPKIFISSIKLSIVKVMSNKAYFVKHIFCVPSLTTEDLPIFNHSCSALFRNKVVAC